MLGVCAAEWAVAAVWRHEDRTSGEDQEAGGGQTEHGPHLRYLESFLRGVSEGDQSEWKTFLVSEWSDEMRGKKCKRRNLLGRSERKKKVALVSGRNLTWRRIKSLDLFCTQTIDRLCVTGPFIVYMLRDIDILEDWTAIKKVTAATRRTHPTFLLKLLPDFSSFSGESSTVTNEEETRKLVFFWVFYLWTKAAYVSAHISWFLVPERWWWKKPKKLTFPAFSPHCLWPQTPDCSFVIYRYLRSILNKRTAVYL